MSTMTTSSEARVWVPGLTFATRLAMVRNQMRWNAKEAALACGFPQSSWRSWEVAGRTPHDFEEVCRRISERTLVSYRWLAFAEYPSGQDLEVRHHAPERGLDPDGIPNTGGYPTFTGEYFPVAA